MSSCAGKNQVATMTATIATSSHFLSWLKKTTPSFLIDARALRADRHCSATLLIFEPLLRIVRLLYEIDAELICCPTTSPGSNLAGCTVGKVQHQSSLQHSLQVCTVHMLTPFPSCRTSISVLPPFPTFHNPTPRWHCLPHQVRAPLMPS